jgi:competence protein ComEA
MSDAPRPVPGTTLVAMLLAAALVATAAGRFRQPVMTPGSPGDATWPDARVDLNRAGAAELTLLPGIGPGLAARIVTDRDAAGPFGDVEELARVHRIGAATVRRLQAYAVAEVGP